MEFIDGTQAEWPIGATVVTKVALEGVVTDGRFDDDLLYVEPEYGVLVPVGAFGKVINHLDDGRVLCRFDELEHSHSFERPKDFLYLIDEQEVQAELDWDGGNPLSEIEGFDVRDEGVVSRTVQFYEDSYTVVTTNANWTHVLDCDGEELFSIGGNPGDDELKRLLQVYHTGLNNGRKWGKAQAKSEIRKALGL